MSAALLKGRVDGMRFPRARCAGIAHRARGHIGKISLLDGRKGVRGEMEGPSRIYTPSPAARWSTQLHRANTDRLWRTWQKMDRKRRLGDVAGRSARLSVRIPRARRATPRAG